VFLYHRVCLRIYQCKLDNGKPFKNINATIDTVINASWRRSNFCKFNAPLAGEVFFHKRTRAPCNYIVQSIAVLAGRPRSRRHQAAAAASHIC